MNKPNYLNASFDQRGVYMADTRFQIDDRGQYLLVRFNGVTYPFDSYDAAIRWMAQQPPPAGSLGLGNAVAKVTHALGIRECGSCADRRLRLNARK